MITSLGLLESVKSIERIDPLIADRINDSDRLRDEIGWALRLPAAVETETPISRKILNVMLPNMTPQDTEFFGCWEPQEAWHGEDLARVLTNIGLTPFESPESKVGTRHEQIGRLAGKSKLLHSAAKAVVYAHMSSGEYETIGFYNVIARRLDDIGEPHIAGLFRQVISHEKIHLHYEKAAVGDALRETASLRRVPGLNRIPGRVFLRTYLPIGVDELGSDRATEFGRILDEFIGESDTQRVASGLARNMAKVLPGIKPSDPFAINLYEKIRSDYRNTLHM